MKKIVLFSILIIILAAFFASSNPDGLEKVAEKLGFIKQAASTPGIFGDYQVQFISNPYVSTIIAGLAGIFIIFGLFWLSAKLFSKS